MVKKFLRIFPIYFELIIGKETWSTVANNVGNTFCDGQAYTAILACSLTFEFKQNCEHFFLIETGK